MVAVQITIRCAVTSTVSTSIGVYRDRIPIRRPATWIRPPCTATATTNVAAMMTRPRVRRRTNADWHGVILDGTRRSRWPVPRR